MATYKALKTCRAGGMLRRAGEVFGMDALADTPAYLMRLVDGTGQAAPKAAGATAQPTVTAKNGATPADLGIEADPVPPSASPNKRKQ
jgi:hypothetical protein